ncbi:MAG: hypothetical protein LBN42_01470 [Oscillospiraceae bacterium]|nr:hypothetical protein [Oscillospiraceae bacterium]
MNLTAVLDKKAPDNRPFYISENIPFLAPEKITELEFDYIVICSEAYLTEIYEYLLSKGVDKEKVIAAYNTEKLDKFLQNSSFIWDLIREKDYIRVAELNWLANQMRLFAKSSG